MTEYRIAPDTNPNSLRHQLARHDAHSYRLRQAEELLTEEGYIEGSDGIWRLPDERHQPPGHRR